MAEWYTTDDADAIARVRAAWRGAPFESPDLLELLLETAREDVLAYAPEQAPPAAGEDPTPPPARYVYAQLQQARNLHAASSVTSAGDIGPDGYTFTPRPLDKTIKQLIRPLDGTPHVL